MHARVLTVLTMLAVAVPAGAQVPPYLAVPSPLERAPASGLYIDVAFTPVRTMQGVVYGRNVNWAGDEQDLILDVWEPEGHEAPFRPAIVWAAGNISVNRGTEQFQWMPELVKRGWVLASIEYRIQPDALGAGSGLEGVIDSVVERGPGALDSVENTVESYHNGQHDMQAAVRWLRANAAELRIDPNWIVVAGHSAGAVITLRVLFNSEDPGESGNPDWPSHVASAIASAGAWLAPATGDPVVPGDPPLLVLHGTNDTQAPLLTGLAPCIATIAVANACEAYVFPGSGHEAGDPVSKTREATDFLYRHVIDVERVETEFVDTSATAESGGVAVSGTLRNEADEPLADERVLVRDGSGNWVETTTGPDGTFAVAVGPSAGVDLRYEGHATGSWLDAPHTAPAYETVMVE